MPRPGFAKLFSLLFTTMMAHAISETARDAIFLATMPASQLALVYLAIAASAVVVARAARSVTKRAADRRRAIAAFLALAALGNALFAQTLGDGAGAFAYYVFTGVVSTVAVLQFWLLMGAMVDVQAAKRVYAPVSAGGVAGAAAGAILASQLLGIVDPHHLLYASSALLTAGACIALTTPKPCPSTVERRRGRAKPRPLGTRRRYVGRLLVITVGSTLALTFVDFAFKLTVANRFAGDASAIGGYLARFYGIVNGLALIFQLAIATRLLERFGVNRALLLMPALVFTGAAALVLGPASGALLVLTAMKGTEGTLKHSLQRSGMEVLYTPLADATRERVKTIVDVVGQRGGQALAALVLLGFVAAEVDAQTLIAVAGGFSFIWIIGLVSIRGPYLALFRQNLEDRTFSEYQPLGELDVNSLEALLEGLNSDEDPLVHASLDLLESFGKSALVPRLVLYHPSNDVKLHALALFARHGDAHFVSVAKRLLRVDDPEVRAAALRAIDLVAPSAERLIRASEDEDPIVRATALVGIVALHDLHMGSADPAEGRTSLPPLATPAVERARIATRLRQAREDCPCDRMDIPGSLALCTSSEDPAVRRALALAIRARPSAGLHDALLELASADEAEVRVAVAQAMAEMPSPAFVDRLIEWVADGATRDAAREALVAIGVPALARLRAGLGSTQLPRRVRRHLPRTISRFPIEDAWPMLVAHLADETDDALRYKALRGLGRLRANHPEWEADRDALLAEAAREVEEAERTLEMRVLLDAAGSIEGEDPIARALLDSLLAQRESRAIERIFRLLGLLLPNEDLRSLYSASHAGNARLRGEALELLDAVVPAGLHDVLLALVRDPGASLEARRESVASARGVTASSPEDARSAVEEAIRILTADRSAVVRDIVGRFARSIGVRPSDMAPATTSRTAPVTQPAADPDTMPLGAALEVGDGIA